MAGVEDTVKDFWSTRPRRPRRGRKIAGVAAGIARRYRIDPTIVRVGFVVATIYGGAGIVLYLLGWLFLPEQDDEVSPIESLIGRGRSSTSSAFTVLLCIALVPTFSWFFGGFFPGFPGIASVVLVGIALYLLHRNRGHLGAAPAEPVAQPMADMPTTAAPMSGTTMPLPNQPVDPLTNEPPPVAERREAEPEVRDTPPAWDPLGAAPFAWDLPEPTPQEVEPEEEPPAPTRRSRISLLTVGVALITAAVLSSVAGGWIDAQHIIGIVLALLGIGMVVGSFRRGGRGLIGFAVPLAAIGIAMTTIFPNGVSGGVGEIKAQPTSVSEVRSEYRLGVGAVELDLTKLPASSSVDTRIKLDLGDVQVIVPESADVDIRCEADLGDVQCLDRERAGTNDNVVTVEDAGPDGPGGLDVDMQIEVGTGAVEVRRG